MKADFSTEFKKSLEKSKDKRQLEYSKRKLIKVLEQSENRKEDKISKAIEDYDKSMAKTFAQEFGIEYNEPQLLESCYINSLKRAAEKQCVSIAFPCISTGVYGYPHEAAAKICLNVLRNYQGDYPKKAIVCCFLKEDKLIYDRLL